MPTEFDPRNFVRMDHSLPENIKIAPLSDRAFRVWHECIYWCSRQQSNGFVGNEMVKTLGLTPKVIAELTKKRGGKTALMEPVEGGWQMHDYLRHNRSRDEISASSEARGKAGDLGNHQRWHVARRKPDPACEHCQAATSAQGLSIAK